MSSHQKPLNRVILFAPLTLGDVATPPRQVRCDKNHLEKQQKTSVDTDSHYCVFILFFPDVMDLTIFAVLAINTLYKIFSSVRRWVL